MKLDSLFCPIALACSLLVISCGSGGGSGPTSPAAVSLAPGTTTGTTSGASGTTGSTTNSTTGGALTSPTTADLGTNASLHGRQVLPPDNPWNTPVDTQPVDPNSDALIASMGLDTGLHPDFGAAPDNGIPYVVVPGTTPLAAVSFQYANQSDSGPYPIPPNPPIEGGSDRHILILDRDRWKLFELFNAQGAGSEWTAGSGAIYDLNSDALRPAGWTSADAAGLPIFPGLVRYDEVVEQGVIRHALRFTVARPRRAYVSPARHSDGESYDSSLPPMGTRVRLKGNVDISGFPAHVQVILQALKTYGMFVADTGSNWFISGTPDPRWNDDELSAIHRISGRDFEVVKLGAVTQAPA